MFLIWSKWRVGERGTHWRLPIRRMALATPLGVYFYDASTYSLLRFTPIILGGESFAFSSTLDRLVVGDWDGLNVWDTTTGQLLNSTQVHEAQVVAFMPGDQRVLFCNFDLEKTFIWDVRSGDFKTTFLGFAQGFQFSADGHRLALFDGGAVKIWAMDSYHLLGEFSLQFEDEDSKDYMESFDLSPDGSLIALGSGFGDQIQIWQVDNHQLLQSWEISRQTTARGGHGLSAPLLLSGPGQQQVKGLQFSPDGSLIAAATGFRRLYQYRVQDATLLFSDDSLGDGLLYSPDGNVLISWGATAKFLNTSTGAYLNALENHMGSANDIAFLPDGDTLAIGSDDASVWLCRVTDGKVIRNFDEHGGRVTDIAVSPDGQFIASGSYYPPAWLWSVNNNSKQKLADSEEFTWVADWVHRFSFSNDGKLLAASIYSDIVVIDRQTLRRQNDHTGMGFGIFSPVEPLLAVWDWGNEDISLYRLGEYRRAERTMRIPSSGDSAGEDSSFIFSNNGKLIALSAVGYILLWSVEDGKLALEIALKNNRQISGLAFSPDDRLLAASYGHKILVWDSSSGELLAELPAFYGLRSIAFSPDGKLLATSSWAGTISLWGIVP